LREGHVFSTFHLHIFPNKLSKNWELGTSVSREAFKAFMFAWGSQTAGWSPSLFK
jgi:hypothetical protein